jgi:hypothetical protein
MTEGPTLPALIAETAAMLDAALGTAESGGLFDLTGLAPRVEQLCLLAVERRDVAVAPDLARLMARLDRLEALLRQRMAAPPADPLLAAKRYRSAAGGDDAG